MSAANVGKRCRWTTYPNAGVGLHDGEIVAYVPAGASLRDAEARYQGYARWDTGLGRLADAQDESDGIPRYLVRVDRGNNTRGKPYAPRWYAPRASTVEVMP